MIRSTLEKLSAMDELLICDKKVNVEYELGGVLKYFKNKRAILFNNIYGHNMKAVGGLFGNRSTLYKLLGINHMERFEYFMNGIVNPEPYVVVERGPVKENIIKRNIDLPRILPIPTFQEKDRSSFITAGILVIKDTKTGYHYTSIRRFQVNGGNELSVLISSPKLVDDLLNMERENKPLEVAIVLGYDEYTLLASQVSSSTYGIDKYEIDSSLRGEPLELVKCETVDILVPASAEIVLEGKIKPNVRKPEGPFGELMGYYGGENSHPVIEISTITHRDNPIFQLAFPCREEHVSNGLIREVELFNYLKNQVNVVDVNVSEGGGYRLNAFVAIDKENEGDGKSAIITALGSNKDLKQVVIVDRDVDIFDLMDIEWAITTRSQPSLDMVIVKGALGSPLEPSHNLRGVTDKVGIDATKPLEDIEGKFERTKIPNFEHIDINKYF